MKTQLTTIFAILVSTAALGAQAIGEPLFKPAILVTLQERDGFIEADAGSVESARAIFGRIEKDRKRFVTTTDAAKADVTLLVLGRGRGPIALDQTTKPVPVLNLAVTKPFADNDYWIAVALRAGEYQLGLVCRTTKGWNACADTIVNDVRSWTETNSSRLQRNRPVTTR